MVPAARMLVFLRVQFSATSGSQEMSHSPSTGSLSTRGAFLWPARDMHLIINTNTRVPAKTHGSIPYMVVTEVVFGLSFLKENHQNENLQFLNSFITV